MKTITFALLNYFIDFCFLCDIVITFRTSYINQNYEEIYSSGKITRHYCQGKFLIDFLSTVPFDTLGEVMTREKHEFLSLFALLKLARITRLNKMISAMNAKAEVKTSVKLTQLIFLTVMYLHFVGCFWFYFVSDITETEVQLYTWVPPPAYAWQDNYVYDKSFTTKYLLSFYAAVLLTTGNDTTPRDTFQVFYTAFFLIIGALVNAIVFGNIVAYIQELNYK